MSSTSQDEVVVWRIFTQRLEVVRDEEWSDHKHECHELIWGTRGSVVAQTDDGYFAVPGSLGLWIPAEVTHRVRAASGTAFYCTYLWWPDDRTPRTDSGPVAVDGLAQALFTGLSERDWSRPQRRHAEDLVISLLTPAALAGLDLPMPADDRARRVARGLLDEPADGRSLADWGRAVGASERNLSRLFVTETGRTFAQWRTGARMRTAVELLAGGLAVSTVARRVGFTTSSAFVSAFRREFGTTPGQFGS